MKYKIGYLRLIFWFYWYLFKFDLKSILKQVKDCLILYIVVNIILGSPVWLGYLLGIITKQGWCYAMATGYLFFWNVVPFTPYTAITIALTLAIHKFFMLRKGNR